MMAQNTTSDVHDLLILARKSLNSQPDSSLYYSQEAYERAKRQTNHWAMVKSLTYIGRVREKQRQPELAISHYFDALNLMSLSDTLDDFNTATLNRNVAAIYVNHNNHQEALAYYDSAIFYLKRHVRQYPDIAIKDRDYRHLFNIRFNKARAQRKVGNIEAAQKDFLSLLDDNDTPGRVQINSLFQIGFLYNDLQLSDSAKRYFHLGVAHKSVDSLRMGRGYHNIGMVHFEQKEYESAIEFYIRAIGMKERLKDKKSLFISLLDLGESYLMMENYSLANSTLERAARTIDESTIMSDPKYYSLYQLQSQALTLSQPQVSRQLLRKFVQCSNEFYQSKEVLSNEERRRAFQLIMKNYWAEKDHQETLLTLDRKYSAWIWVIIIGFAVVSYLGFQVLRVYRRKRLFREIQKATRNRTIRVS